MTVSFLKRVTSLRAEFHTMSLKKTGYNGHDKYAYFELRDFLPVLTDLNEKYELLPVLSFPEKGIAELRVIDCRSTGEPQEFVNYISFKVDYIAQASTISKDKKEEGKWLIKPQTIQETGKLITYIRRYLYSLYVDLIENDIVDSGGKAATQEDIQIENFYEAVNAFLDSKHILNEQAQREIIHLCGELPDYAVQQAKGYFSAEMKKLGFSWSAEKKIFVKKEPVNE